MKKNVLIVTVALLSGSLLAADSNDVATAATALSQKANYAWNTTVAVPADAQFKPGPTEGKTEKDGFTAVKMSFFDNPMQIVLKGKKAAFTDQDGAWQSSDAGAGEGPGQFMAMMVQNLQVPADEAKELVSFAKELKKEGDVYSSDLTDEGAKAKLSFRRGAAGATVTNPKGSAKFWIKDGVLTKYEFKVKGTVSWNGNDFETDRTTTVEIKDVGTTKVEVPEEAKKKLS